ncbi:MAG TPA: hypothetical protein PL072_00955 [Phycisphaerales bacterium]|nr:hypothetical protein [Phycisphaerales bacterium]
MNRLLRALLALILAGCVAQSSFAVDVYSQPPTNSGALIQSSWWDPDGSDWDIWIWDSFILPSSQAVTEVRWRGGYINNQYLSGPAFQFEVSIYPSIAANSQPDVVGGPLVRYRPPNNCGETLVGTFGGKALFDYHYALPSAFQATGGVKYWVLIKAYQHGIPDWGLSTATGGNGSHFRWLEGGPYYQNAPGDAAFTLVGSSAATVTIAASADPAQGGTIQGAGEYPVGSNATLVANPTPGYGFVNWTEGPTQVSASPQYTFAANAPRTLVAHFVPAYTVTTSAFPDYAGSVSAGGTFNQGASATVTATPAPGFYFDYWADWGTPVSSAATYTHAVLSDENLVAHFAPEPLTVAFDFDNAPAYTLLPATLTSGPLGATLSATGGGFLFQSDSGVSFHPAGMTGVFLAPASVFASDLQVDFTRSLTSFSIRYSPQELGCDTSATMRATAYLRGALVGSATAIAPQPGTWPLGVLTYDAPAGLEFDRVVVHYDARPATCQDWGPIFFADDMVVRMASLPPACAADFDGSGGVAVADLFAYLDAWFAQFPGGTPGSPSADFDGDAGVTVADLFGFLDAWFAEFGVCGG